ncbi:MAG: helix-turn-helix domain-containing protein, partial [Myxococcales bacterium]|nr:helix-turn-helix domain-containing protein [Myxococcales bacterium]
MSDDTHAEMDALQGRVFALAERGASVADIAEEVGRQQRTVKRWLSDPALQQRWGVECVLRRGKLRLVAPVEDEADEGEG